MMGMKERPFAPLPPVSLEDLVPPDHFYRHLDRSLDLGFVRELVRWSSPRPPSEHWPSVPRHATTGSDAPADPIGRQPAAAIDARPISASAQPIPTRRRCRSAAVGRTSATTTTTSSTAAGPGSS